MARKRKKANRFGGGGVHEAGWGEPKVFGQTLDEVLAHLYFCLSEWFAEMKVLAERDGVPVRQLLLRGMQEARRSGRVVNALDDTAYKLFGGGWRGQDLLRFFVMKCPHYREAFLRGEVPQQPWGLSAGATPREADGQASSAPQETRTGRGVALPSVTGNQTPDVKSKSKRRRKRKGRPPVKQDKKKLRLYTQWAKEWHTGKYKTYADCAADFGGNVTEDDIRRAVDYARKNPEVLL